MMSDPNHYSPFPHSLYTSSTEFLEKDPGHGWAAPVFSQPSFTHQGPSDVTAPSLREFPENAPTSVTQDLSFNSKVPISRSANLSVVPNRVRVSRACENCRDQKVKCSGQRPTCRRCQESGIQCSYADRKREKMARRLDYLTARVEAFETLLQNIYPSLDSQTCLYVENSLNKQHSDSDPVSGRQISEASLSVFNIDPGSPLGSIDFTSEDFNRDEKIQAMGFVGEHSEVAWMYRLRQILNHFPEVSQSKSPDCNSVTSVNFFLDDSSVTVIEDVDLFWRPSPAIADHLVDSYFQAVHPSFPIIGKVTFLGQYQSFYSAPSVRPGKWWLAILNLIFAIATKYSVCLSLNSEAIPDDHLTYFSRAWKLSMRDIALLDHPNLQQVQVEGLSAFYLMTTGQTNRSWRISCVSIQSAITMELNLRNESNIVCHNSRETRYRVWWSLYVLHISLCVMTGRLPISSEDSCTTPFPVPFIEEEFSLPEIEQLIDDHEARSIFMENLSSRFSADQVEATTIPETSSHRPSSRGKLCEQVASVAFKFITPNISLYFLHLVELGLIMRRSVDALYAPGAARKSWRYIEMIITSLNTRADAWLSKLPTEFHFAQEPSTNKRERLSLALSFYSTKLLITQPCLGRLLRQASLGDQVKTFCSKMAALCVDLACQMLELLPDAPDLAWVHNISPQWYLVHYIMQAATVLLISLFIKEGSGAVQYTDELKRVSKAVDWLAHLGTRDVSAQRAWTVCSDLFSRHKLGAVFGHQKDKLTHYQKPVED